MDTEGEDHAVDTLRYACMTRPIEAEKPPSRNDQISTIHDVKLEQLFEENERGSRNAIGYDRI
jgi:hypothetical protein